MMYNIIQQHSVLQIVLLASLCLLAFRLKWLTLSGAIAAFITALILAADDLRNFVIPMFLLVGGTLLSRLNRDEKEKAGRNARQVMANGLVGLGCLLISFYQTTDVLDQLFFNAFLLSFMVSISDTFSSETGKYLKGKTIDITSGKEIAKGLSGGISIAGTIGGLIAVVLCFVLIVMIYPADYITAMILAFGGFAGMLIDSVLGSLLQVKYKTENGDITESELPEDRIYSGYQWCTNDLVNLLSNLITVAIYLITGWILM